MIGLAPDMVRIVLYLTSVELDVAGVVSGLVGVVLHVIGFIRVAEPLEGFLPHIGLCIKAVFTISSCSELSL